MPGHKDIKLGNLAKILREMWWVTFATFQFGNNPT
jgi:hypothetical protein